MCCTRRLALVCAAAAIATLATAWPHAEDRQKPSAVFRAATQLVQVNLIAVDRKGDPVPDLNANELILTDNNAPQKISVFHLERNEPSSERPEPLPPGTFTNQAEGVRNVTVILMDNLNIDSHSGPLQQIADLAYAKGEARKFLRDVGTHDQVALYVMARQVSVLHDFTNDSRALMRALDSYRPSLAMPDYISGAGSNVMSGPSGRANGRATLRQRAPQESATEEAGFFIQRRVDATVEAFRAIATHLAGIPGRKNIVWLTTGFPIAVNYDPMAPGMRFDRSTGMFDLAGLAITSMSPQLQKAARAFNDANMAIYPVDVRGLMNASRFSAAMHTLSSEPGVSAGQTEIDSMIDIAERTGGRAFYATNGITEAIQAASSDARVTYLLGYYSSDSNYDGRFHSIKIRTTRPGVTLRYRRGYFALPPEQAGLGEHLDVFAPVVWSPLEASSLGVTVRARRRIRNGSPEAGLEVLIDPKSLRLENLNGRWVGQIELVIVNLSPSGENLKGFDQTRKLNLLPSTYEQMKREGLEFPLFFRIPPETERIRLVVRDSPSGSMGSVTIPLSQVPRS